MSDDSHTTIVNGVPVTKEEGIANSEIMYASSEAVINLEGSITLYFEKWFDGVFYYENIPEFFEKMLGTSAGADFKMSVNLEPTESHK